MEIIRTVADMRTHVAQQRQAGQTLALVPTMGALHEGHLTLVEKAHQHASHVTVSIFVNPTQFAPNEDFSRYPRPLEADLARLRESGQVDAVFVPTEDAMYPYGHQNVLTWVTVAELDRYLCGQFREGHFRGVTTVVSKLFLICQPHIGVFGLKDAQQFLILRRMVRELHFDVDLVGVPTVREADGLALSSRNRYLTPEERTQATVIHKGLKRVETLILAGEQRIPRLVEALRATLSEAPAGQVQYADIMDTDTLHPVHRIAPKQQVLVAVAVFFGKTRLIDNVVVRAPAENA